MICQGMCRGLIPAWLVLMGCVLGLEATYVGLTDGSMLLYLIVYGCLGLQGVCATVLMTCSAIGLLQYCCSAVLTAAAPLQST